MDHLAEDGADGMTTDYKQRCNDLAQILRPLTWEEYERHCKRRPRVWLVASDGKLIASDDGILESGDANTKEMTNG